MWHVIWKSSAFRVAVRGLVTGVVLLTCAGLAGCPEQPGYVRNGVLEHDGRSRTYRLVAPSGLTEPAPLVVALHPFTATGRGMARITGFDAMALREGFIVVYPDGVTRRWSAEPGETDLPGPFQSVDDVGFIDALLDKLIAEYPVDPERVFVTGASAGAGMTYRLACELPERFAGAAAVMATMSEAMAAQCPDGAAVPFLVMHGTEDPFFPFEGGEVQAGPGGGEPYLGARETAEFWAARNGCLADPTVIELPDSAPQDGTRVVIETYVGCPVLSKAALYIIEGGGHTWPGQPWSLYGPRLVGATSREIDASRVIWEFFASQRP